MNAEIKLFPKHEACQIVLDKILNAGGLKASLFKGKLVTFLDEIFKRDMLILGECTHEACEQLNKLGPDNPIIKGLKFFHTRTALEIILIQAERHGLPVAMIKQELLLFVNQLYQANFILATPDSESTKAFFAQDKLVLMNLKPKQETQV